MQVQSIQHYGTERWGCLRTVMLHSPRESIKQMNNITTGYYLFDSIPDVGKYLAEHAAYKKLLQSHNIEVLELSDYVQYHKSFMDTLPSLAYLHDIAVITRKGAILSQMGGGRQGEEIVVKEALTRLEIPLFHEFSSIDHFEGCLLLSPEIILIVCTERHHRQSIENLIPKVLTLFDEVIYVEAPKARRFMHADMIYGQVNKNLALAFLPAFLSVFHITNQRSEPIDFKSFMASREIEIIDVSDQEQKNWACSFVPLKQNVIFHYDIALSAQTKKVLYGKGVEIIEFHPNAILAGGGSLRCLTLQIFRQ
ncbi:MAG: N-dimethylarginine dimethylaminohydrolase [Firmicutes bacterium]|nr:N-dimethylarginine dimethylaminohydrolase [Bacillota bacterium]